jgi:hypothetical protein
MELSDFDEFKKAMQHARSKSDMSGIPVQIIAHRDEQILGFGGMRDADLSDAVCAVVAILGGLTCDKVYLGADAFYGGPDGINPETGEKWVEAEMDFDFRENPNTVVREGLLLYEIGMNGDLTDSCVLLYNRDEKGVPNEYEEVPLQDGEVAQFQKALNHYLNHLEKPLADLQRLYRELPSNPAIHAAMDLACVAALKERFGPAVQFALTVNLDGDDERSKALRVLSKKDGFEIHNMRGDSDDVQ